MRIEGIDDIDNKILNIIKDNARLSYKEIGELAGISRVSVRSRMDALQEKGIIKGFQTVIDPTSAPEGTKFSWISSAFLNSTRKWWNTLHPAK